MTDLSLHEILDAEDLAPHEKKGLLLKLYPNFLATGGRDESPAKAPDTETKSGFERFVTPTIEAGTNIAGMIGGGLASMVTKAPQIPGALLDLTMQGGPGAVITGPAKEFFNSVKEGTAQGAEEEARTNEPFPAARGAIASVPFVGKPVARMIGKGALGDVAGAVGEALPFALPTIIGKSASLVSKLRGLPPMLERAQAAAKIADEYAASPAGKAASRISADSVPELQIRNAQNMANEELSKMGAPIVSGSPDLPGVRTGISRALDEARTAASKDALARFAERITPTEAGNLAGPTIKATKAEMLDKYPRGTIGFEQNVTPMFGRGAVKRGLAAFKTEMSSRVAKIPLDDAQQWGLLMKSVRGDDAAIRAIRSHVANNLMGGAQDPGAFVAKFRTMPEDSVYAIFGEDAGPIYQTLQRIAQIEEAMKGGNPQLLALDDAISQLMSPNPTKLGKVWTGPGTLSSKAIKTTQLALQNPNAMLVFSRALDSLTRGGKPAAFVTALNGLSRISKDNE